MTWLSGKPKAIIPLRWPADDPIVEASKNRHLALNTLYPSILDDQILYTIVQRDPPTSFVYLARVHEAIANNQQQVTFTVCAVLPYAVHGVALLTQRTGFASLTYDKQYFTVTVRVHDWDGSVLNETSTYAEAAYGRLVVQGDLLGVCISSGEELDDEFNFEEFPPAWARVDYDHVNPSGIQYDTPYGDKIFIWNWATGLSHRTKTPPKFNVPLRHTGIFGFVEQNFMAVGGAFWPSSPLETSNISHEFTPTYSHDENVHYTNHDFVPLSSSPNPDDTLMNHNRRGLESPITVPERASLSTDTLESLPDFDDALANDHHGGLRSRITVSERALYSTDIISWPVGSANSVSSHKNTPRIIQGTANPYSPAAYDSGISIFFEIDENDHALCDFMFDTSNRLVSFLCDFDQRRCTSRGDITSRKSLKSLNAKQIEVDNDVAVTIIQCDYFAGDEFNEDSVEFLRLYRACEPSPGYIDCLWRISESRKKRKLGPGTPTLHAERKHCSRLVFTRSLVSLSPREYWSMDCQKLALSTSGIVYVPDPGEEGHIFVFED